MPTIASLIGAWCPSIRSCLFSDRGISLGDEAVDRFIGRPDPGEILGGQPGPEVTQESWHYLANCRAVEYNQVSVEAWRKLAASGRPPASGQTTARTMYGELEALHRGRTGDSFVLQHIREVAIDHENGIFAGTNDVVGRIGGRPPMRLKEFVSKHRHAFV
jgi:hypothetical protein